MRIPSVAPSGPDAYRKANDDDDQNGGCRKSASPPDSKGGPNDPFEEAKKNLPDGWLKDEITFLQNSSGGM